MKEWLSAKEIADLRLPGIPDSKRCVNMLAADKKWATRHDATGMPLFKKRQGKGGGLVYHRSLVTACIEPVRLVISALPPDAVDLAARLQRLAPKCLIIPVTAEQQLVIEQLARRRGVSSHVVMAAAVQQAVELLKVAL